MRAFLCLALLALIPSAEAGVLKNDTHRRFLFQENTRGHYVISTYMSKLDKVRLESCEGLTNPKCSILTELSHTKLEHLKEPMLKMLREYRAEVEKKKNGFWMFFSRYGMKSGDTEAIDKLISEVEEFGPGHLVLLTDENLGQDAPTLNTPDFSRELAARLKAVLESGAPITEIDCLPYLRQQGL